MRFKVVSAAVSAVIAISLLGASGATAATQAGSTCIGNESTEDFLLFGLATGGSPPAAIPSDGVITKWTFNIVPIPPGFISQNLKILRPSSPGQFQVIGESGLQPISSGLNTFATRIPVHSGDLIGVNGFIEGESASVYCETGNPGDRLGVIAGSPGPGSNVTQLDEESSLQVPITVSVEPDADNDGFGDETQDACPQSAATQVACPLVTLSTTKQVRKGSVVIVVASSTEAPVTVKGVVNLGKGRKARLNGGTKSLTPGALGKFTLKFSRKLKKKLKELSLKQKLTLKVTVTGTNVAGQVTTKTLKVKLKGQSKG